MAIMSKRQILIVIGLWTMAFLFLGFPSSWDKVLALVTGLILVIMAYSLRPDRSLDSRNPVRREHVPYVEHKSEPAAEAAREIISDGPAPTA